MSIERVYNNHRVVNINKYYKIENTLHVAIYNELNKKYELSKESIDKIPDGLVSIISMEELINDLGYVLDEIKRLSIESHALNLEGLFAIMDFRPGKADNLLNGIAVPSNIKVVKGKKDLFKLLEE